VSIAFGFFFPVLRMAAFAIRILFDLLVMFLSAVSF